MARDVSTADESDILRGTTLKIYRYMYRQGRELGLHDIQRGMSLSSVSIAQYHVRKLLRAGLIREEGGGYVVDRVLFENIIRIRRALIPFQTTYSFFFAATLVILLTVLRPPTVTPLYAFALVVNCVALAVSVYEAVKTLGRFR